MVIFLYNLYILGIYQQTMLYPKPCYKEVYVDFIFFWSDE